MKRVAEAPPLIPAGGGGLREDLPPGAEAAVRHEGGHLDQRHQRGVQPKALNVQFDWIRLEQIPLTVLMPSIDMHQHCRVGATIRDPP